MSLEQKLELKSGSENERRLLKEIESAIPENRIEEFEKLYNQYKGKSDHLEKFLINAGTYNVFEAVASLELVDFYIPTEKEKNQIRQGEKESLGIAFLGGRLINQNFKYAIRGDHQQLKSATINTGFDAINHLMIFGSNEQRKELFDSKNYSEKKKQSLVRKRIEGFSSDLKTSRTIKRNMGLVNYLNEQVNKELGVVIEKLLDLRQQHPDMYEKSIEEFTKPSIGGTIIGWFLKDEIKKDLPKYIQNYLGQLKHLKLNEDRTDITKINEIYGLLFTYYLQHNKVNSKAHLAKRLDDLEFMIELYDFPGKKTQTLDDHHHSKNRNIEFSQNLIQKIEKYDNLKKFTNAVLKMRSAVNTNIGRTVFQIADLIDIYPVVELRREENLALTHKKNIKGEELKVEFQRAFDSFKDLFYDENNRLMEDCTRNSVPRRISSMKENQLSYVIKRDDWKIIKEYSRLTQITSFNPEEVSDLFAEPEDLAQKNDILSGTSMREFRNMYETTILANRVRGFIQSYEENISEYYDTPEKKDDELKKVLHSRESTKINFSELKLGENFESDYGITFEELAKRHNKLDFSFGDLSASRIQKDLFLSSLNNNIYSPKIVQQFRKTLAELKEHKKVSELEDETLVNKLELLDSDFGTALIGQQYVSGILTTAEKGYIKPHNLNKVAELYNAANNKKNKLADVLNQTDLKEKDVLEIFKDESFFKDKYVVEYQNMPTYQESKRMIESQGKNMREVFKYAMNGTQTHFDGENKMWISEKRDTLKILDLMDRVNRVNILCNTEIKLKIRAE